MRLRTEAIIPPRLPPKMFLSICCLFHDQVHLAPENRGDDTTAIATENAPLYLSLLPSWPGNGSSRQQCRYHLERSPGTEPSHPVVSSVMTALCHENSGEDIASIVDMQASHMVLLLFVVPRQWPFEGVALVTP